MTDLERLAVAIEKLAEAIKEYANKPLYVPSYPMAMPSPVAPEQPWKTNQPLYLLTPLSDLSGVYGSSSNPATPH